MRSEPESPDRSHALPPRRVVRPERSRHEPAPSHERWLVSYADFVTLLFAFFATMYAISTVDNAKMGAMLDSLKESFGPGQFYLDRVNAAAADRAKAMASSAPKPGAASKPGAEMRLEDVQARLQARLAQSIDQQRVAIEMDRRGLVISIREAGSFSVGKAELSPEAADLLRDIGQTLSEIGNYIRVEGHTDDVPIHTVRFASNWELSTARATNVIAFMLNQTAMNAAQLSAAGYAEFHPREPNTSDGSRARNRRVDIVILNPATRAAEEPVKTPTS